MVFANPKELLENSAYILLQSPSLVLVAEDVCSQFCWCLASSLYRLAWETANAFCWGTDTNDVHVYIFCQPSPCPLPSYLLHMSESVWPCCERGGNLPGQQPGGLSQWVQTETCTVGLQGRAGLNPLASGVKGNAWGSYFRWSYFHKANLDFRISFGPSKSIFKDHKSSVKKFSY